MTPLVILLLFLVGVLCSAFFSGAETGLYRVSRVRLVLDSLGGDWIARGLLWLANRPALFVATTLIGNNLANYMTSAAIVVGTARIFGSESFWIGLIAPVIMSPVIFVYGELLPKTLFYQAPNLLLRRVGPLFFLFGILVLPVTIIIWSLGWLVQSVFGQTPLRFHPGLARKELQAIIREGHDVGILQPAQQKLAQNLFTVAPKPVSQFMRPVARIPQIRRGSPVSDVKRVARRQRASLAAIVEGRQRDLVGYVRVIDLYLRNDTTVDASIRPLLKISQGESHIEALIQMQSRKHDLAAVVDSQGRTVGLLLVDSLSEPLLSTE